MLVMNKKLNEEGPLSVVSVDTNVSREKAGSREDNNFSKETISLMC
jgi:hypothetical protein